MTHRLRHDVAFAAAPLLAEPLRDLMDEWELGEFRAYCYETLLAALEAYDYQVARERRRLPPLPSDN